MCGDIAITGVSGARIRAPHRSPGGALTEVDERRYTSKSKPSSQKAISERLRVSRGAIAANSEVTEPRIRRITDGRISSPAGSIDKDLPPHESTAAFAG